MNHRCVYCARVRVVLFFGVAMFGTYYAARAARQAHEWSKDADD